MLLKTSYFILLFLIFVCHIVVAQEDYTITVIDEQTGEVLKDAFIRGADQVPGKDYLKISAKPGDTVEIEVPHYPSKDLILADERTVRVTVSKNVDEPLFVVVDEFAKFPGGMAKYYEYVRDNLNYPAEAVQDRIEGKVFVEFVIAVDGSIERGSARVTSSADARFNAEAIRIASESSAWIPGKKDGKAVRQRMVMPYYFKPISGKRKR